MTRYNMGNHESITLSDSQKGEMSQTATQAVQANNEDTATGGETVTAVVAKVTEFKDGE